MPTVPSDLEALRRRLYAPSATDADRAAYEALLPGPAVPVAVPARRRRPLAPALVLGVLVAVCGFAVCAFAVAATVGAAPARPTAARTPAASAVLVVPATDVPVGSAARGAFAAAVGAGLVPGLDAWFADHPGELPAAVRGAVHLDRTDLDGRGPASIPLDPPLPWRARAVTVIVVTDRDSAVAWTASRTVLGPDFARHRQALIAAVASARAGIPSVATATLADALPSRLDLHVPAAVRWHLRVEFADAAPLVGGARSAVAE